MKVLHVIAMDQVGGAEKQVERLIRTTDPGVKHDIVVCNAWIHEMFQDSLGSICDITHWKYKWNIKVPSFVRSYFLKNWLKNRSYSTVLCHSTINKTDLIFTLHEYSKNEQECNIVFYDHGATWDHDEEVLDILRLYDRYVSVSTGSKIMLERKFGISPDLIHMIPNVMPDEEFELISNASISETDELPDSDKLPDGVNDHFHVLFLGRLTHQKGIHVLVRAISYLEEDVHLSIVGKGPREDRLRELARELDVEDRVTFWGFQKNPTPFLQWSDVMVVPSIREPFGLVVQEAGAAALPVIAPEIDGIPDMVENGISGFLIEPTVPLNRWPEEIAGYSPPTFVVNRKTNELMEPRLIDPEDLAEKIRFIKNNESVGREAGTNLQERIREQFLFSSLSDRFLDLLR